MRKKPNGVAPNDDALPWWKHYMADNLTRASRLTANAICARYLLQDEARLRSPLPSDDNLLASMARLPLNEWKDVKVDALDGFWLDDAGWWNPAIETQRIEALEEREGKRRRTQAGREAAKAAREADRRSAATAAVTGPVTAAVTESVTTSVAGSVTRSVTESVTDVVTGHPSPSPSPSPSEKKRKSSQRRGAGTGTSVAVEGGVSGAAPPGAAPFSPGVRHG